MYVIKRNLNKEPVKFDKITARIQKLVDEFNLYDIDATLITQKLSTRIFSGITTTELDNLASQICMGMFSDNPNFGKLGGFISVSNHQKNTKSNFLEVVTDLKNNTDINGNICPLINDEIYEIALEHSEAINKIIDFERDFLIDFFGFKTLERSYLLKINDNREQKIVERPQHLFMRVAICIHGTDFENVKKTYDSLSLKQYTHATPTLFNAGTNYKQLSSCFLTAIDDSIEGIFKTYADCGTISKWSGGIGVHISNIRSKGSYIRKTGGKSDGLIPLLRTFNSIARQFNQGGKRLGSFAIYLEPHHADVFEFLEAKKNTGSDEDRARDLFYAMWISDLFMEQVEKDGVWYLMDPSECPNLPDVYGDEYKELYNYYVSLGKYKKKIKARELWDAIISSQVETGMPYMSYKDHVNRKSNQKNIGTIKSSNLCNEINEVSNADEIAVCNLASICLSSILEYPNDPNRYIEWLGLAAHNKQEIINIGRYMSDTIKLYSEDDCSYCKLLKALLKDCRINYTEITREEYEVLKETSINRDENDISTVPQLFTVDKENGVFSLGGYSNAWKVLKPRINYNKLASLAYDLCANLNKIIDINFYPVEKTKVSNLRHRPIGIGVQGLADLFFKLKISFDSEEASDINKKVFETIYYGAMISSIDLAKKYGHYSTFEGSPLSKGEFQFNLWGMKDEELSGMYDWSKMRESVISYGARNSLLIALMPTASTSQIMGSFVEAIECQTSNLYTRRTLAGDFTVINPYLMKDLIDLGIWNEDTRDRLIYDRGSVQKLRGLPLFLKNIYKTVFEISQKTVILLSAERGPFVCQSQSLNLFFDSPNLKLLTQAHFLGWKKGLKTGMYYCRSKPASTGQKFGIDINKEKKFDKEDIESVSDDEGCFACSS